MAWNRRDWGLYGGSGGCIHPSRFFLGGGCRAPRPARPRHRASSRAGARSGRSSWRSPGLSARQRPPITGWVLVSGVGRDVRSIRREHSTSAPRVAGVDADVYVECGQQWGPRRLATPKGASKEARSAVANVPRRVGPSSRAGGRGVRKCRQMAREVARWEPYFSGLVAASGDSWNRERFRASRD